jgi:cytochrome c biogenesis protein CcmG, thiol:disulfide interchange protein DsbE
VNLKGVFFLLVGLIIGVALGALIIFSGDNGSSGDKRRLPPTVGSKVEDFELQVLGGERRSLSSYAGTPVVMNFWATWCPPCKEEMPLLDQLALAYADDLVVLGINYNEEERIVQQYITAEGIKFPIMLDFTGNVSTLYFVRNYPTTFFIDAEGVLRAQHLGLLTEDLLGRYLQTIGIEP